MLGIYGSSEALRIAREKDLDLVEISANATPPVCKILDYGKYQYQEAKKKKESKKKQHIVHLKEVKLHPRTETHDYNFKMRHAREFLIGGDRVKITMVYRGREMAHLDYGRHLIDKMVEDLVDIGDVETEIKMEGRNLSVIFLPSQTKISRFEKEAKANAKNENQ